MPVLCPSCGNALPPDDINVAKDVGFCRSCNNAFALSQQIAGTSDPQRKPMPSGTQVLLTRDFQRIAAVIPPQGVRGIGAFFLLFSGFWNLITWGVFAGFVLSMVNAPPPPPPTPEAFGMPPPSEDSPWMLLFFIPHMTIGIVTAGVALFCIFGDVALAMDKNAVLLQRRLLGYTWSRSRPLAELSAITLTVAYSSNRQPVYGVGFRFSSGRPMTFGTGLTQDEKEWLVGEFDDFWKSVRA